MFKLSVLLNVQAMAKKMLDCDEEATAPSKDELLDYPGGDQSNDLTTTDQQENAEANTRPRSLFSSGRRPWQKTNLS